MDIIQLKIWDESVAKYLIGLPKYNNSIFNPKYKKTGENRMKEE